MGKGLLAWWRRRIVARGLVGAALFAVPVGVAALIGFGATLSGVAGGLSAVTTGPDAAPASETGPAELSSAVAPVASKGGAAPAASDQSTTVGDGSDGTGVGISPTTGSGGSDGTSSPGGGVVDAPDAPGLPGPLGGGGAGGGDNPEETVNGAVNGVNDALGGINNTVGGLLGN